MLPPPPITAPSGEYAWLDWYSRLTNYLNQSGSIPWDVIDFSNSNITAIQTRHHNDLQLLQGGATGEYYHLTAAQWASIPGATPQPANFFYAGPTSGASAVPGFRTMVTQDLPKMDYLVPVTGFSYTFTNSFAGVIIEPVGTLATGTLVFPAAPVNGQTVQVDTTQTITTLTLTPGAGTTIVGGITTLAANGFASWYFRSATSRWYRHG